MTITMGLLYDQHGNFDPAKKLITLLIIVGIVIGFGFSGLEKLDTNQFGLARSTWSGEVETDMVYEAGMHWIGLFKEFIAFPSIQQTITYYTSESNAVTGRTQDGLAISLDISFQYQLLKEGIAYLYTTMGESYDSIFWQFARDVIRDVASLYTAIEFFNNRTVIGTDMEMSMVEEFNLEYNVNIPAYQLLQIDLPDTFEQALERAEVARQEIEIALLEQEKALIEAETLILIAQAQYNVTIIEAQAEADAFIILMQAQADAVNITLTQQALSYYALAQTLNLTSAELLAFLWIQALTEIGEFGNLIIIGDNTPDILITTNGTINP